MILGSPKNDIADWVWGDEAAPWETVDGFYYPDRGNLNRHEQLGGFSSVEACRAWVRQISRSQTERGDYECGIGHMGMLGTLKIYRRTVR